MRQNLDHDTPAAQPTTAPPSASASADSRRDQRRKFLTRGLVGGTAVLLAARPIATLAQSTSTGTRFCSFSGWQSGLQSHTPAQTCHGGKPVSYYQTKSNWPKTSGGFVINPDAKFSDIFGTGTSSKLIDLLTTSASSNEAHFICALVNAANPAVTIDYPYTQAQVKDFYVNPTHAGVGATVSDIATFFKNNLENL
jgi:hypothetical protein